MAIHDRESTAQLLQALELRKKYTRRAPCEVQENIDVEVHFGADGLMQVVNKGSGTKLTQVPSLAEYYTDMEFLFRTRSSGPVTSLSYHRLRLLQAKFEMYTMLATDQENEQAIDTGHRDFYNVVKVDTHVHHSASMNAKHLQRFMKRKLKTASEDIVDTAKDGKPRTLGMVFGAMGIAPQQLSVDRLQVWADRTCMHRFDRFNNKYSPMGHNDLRTIFLKTDNAMGGRYLAEITKELIDDLVFAKYYYMEWRLSIYGRKLDEWDKLSKWVLGLDGKGLGAGQALLSKHVGWMIQIPRLFSLYRSSDQLNNFGEMLENIFRPIFEATANPEKAPHIAEFLKHVTGFDTVDDESKSENPVQRNFSSRERRPCEWDIVDNPSYKYYSYYIQANIQILNQLRSLRGLNTFSFRPHAGEAGEVHHLDTAFLLADGINHGINLRKAPSLQYLYYLAGIGIALSPCSNNQLFLTYEKSPFGSFFTRGLNVSLSTDDPLMFHQTKEPLIEEYSIAKQYWHLNAVDLCEIARNSVLQSGFADKLKAEWLGTASFLEENVPTVDAVPDLRLRFRSEAKANEFHYLHGDVNDEESLLQVCLHTKSSKHSSLRLPVSRTMPVRRGLSHLDPEEQEQAAERSQDFAEAEVQDADGRWAPLLAMHFPTSPRPSLSVALPMENRDRSRSPRG